MKQNKNSQSGFGMLEALLAVAAVVIIGGVGAYLYHHDHKANSPTANTLSTNTSTHSGSNTTPLDPYSGWKTYKDVGYAAASGVSIRYPSDWKINVAGANVAGDTTNPTATVNIRSIDITTPETPMQEWNTCAAAISADACGAGPGDKTLSGTETTINGLDAYSATMQSTLGTYYVTVVESNKSASSGGTPFVELTLPASSSSIVATYQKIVASASFPN